MTIIAGQYLGNQTYTFLEIVALCQAVTTWLDANRQTLDPQLAEVLTQNCMLAGLKAADIPS